MRPAPFAALLLCLSSAAQAAETTIHIDSDRFLPFFGDPASERPGYVVEILRAMSKARGVNLVYRERSGARMERSIETGDMQCLGEIVTEARPALAYSTQRFGEDRPVFWVRPGNRWRWKGDLKDLVGLRLGAVSGWVYPEPLQSYLTAPEHRQLIHWIAEGDPQLKHLRMLKAKRIDVFMDSEVGVKAVAEQHGLPAQIAGALSDAPLALRIGCHRAQAQHQEWLDILDAGIVELRRSGELRPILGRYGVADWE